MLRVATIDGLRFAQPLLRAAARIPPTLDAGYDPRMDTVLEIEPTGAADTGRCACCGHVSRRVWGLVRRNGEPHAAYFVHWTVEHVFDRGAHFDLIIGQWGEGTSAADRCAVSLEYRILDTGPGLMVIDSHSRPIAQSELVGHCLKRDDVVGGPLAPVVFAVCDAVLDRDPRLAALWDAPGEADNQPQGRISGA